MMIGLMLGLVSRGIVAPHGPVFDPENPLLRWAPPAQTAPTILTFSRGTAGTLGNFSTSSHAWTNTSGNGKGNGPRVFDDDEDVTVIGASAERLAGYSLTINGGRHVRLVAGFNRGLVNCINQTGSVYIEGVRFDLAETSVDAFAVSGKAGHQPDVYVQRCFATGLHGTSGGTHADFFQIQGPVGRVRIDSCTFDSNYQGIFIAPGQLISRADISRVDGSFNDLTPATSGTHLLFMRDLSVSPPSVADPLYPVAERGLPRSVRGVGPGVPRSVPRRDHTDPGLRR